MFYGISRYKKRPSYHDWQLGLKLYDMEYMGINFGKEIQTETKAGLACKGCVKRVQETINLLLEEK